MRNIVRSYLITDAPAVLQLASTITASTTIAKSGNAAGIRQKVYTDPYQAAVDEGMQSRVIDKLNEWYFGKCAYCERFYKLDVEHFRPKGELRGEDNSITSNTGYYWLGYEWSNLLPSCISCNRDGGKGSKFPFLNGGARVTSPVYDVAGNLDRAHCLINHHLLVGELPALLNPETDQNLDSYFSFEIDQQKQGIRIKGVDGNRRGEITAKICKLNRQEIRRDRLQNVVIDLVSSIHNSVAILSRTGNNIAFAEQLDLYFDKIHNDCNLTKLSHTMLRRYIVASSQNFDAIVVPFVNPNFQLILSQAFKNYISKHSSASAIVQVSSATSTGGN